MTTEKKPAGAKAKAATGAKAAKTVAVKPAVPPAKPIEAMTPPVVAKPVVAKPAPAPPLVEAPKPAAMVQKVEPPKPVVVAKAVPAPLPPALSPLALSPPALSPLAKVEPAKDYQEILGFFRDNIDALARSSSVVSKGFEDFGKVLTAFTQESVESGISITKQILASKTIRDVMVLQTDYARKSIDKAIDETTQLSSLSASIAEKAMAPLGARFTAVVQRFTRNAA